MAEKIITQTEKAPKSVWREIWSWVWELSLAVIAAILIRVFLLDFIGVSGPSMIPTLLHKQHMMVNKIVYRVSEPHRGQVVVCKYPDRKDNIVKRIIGLPGETIELRDGLLLINGIPLHEPYVNNGLTGLDEEPVVVPEGHYFVMGDNRFDSQDSRRVGTIAKSEIKGRVEAVVWPLNSMHWLKNPYSQDTPGHEGVTETGVTGNSQ